MNTKWEWILISLLNLYLHSEGLSINIFFFLSFQFQESEHSGGILSGYYKRKSVSRINFLEKYGSSQRELITTAEHNVNADFSSLPSYHSCMRAEICAVNALVFLFSLKFRGNCNEENFANIILFKVCHVIRKTKSKSTSAIFLLHHISYWVFIGIEEKISIMQLLKIAWFCETLWSENICSVNHSCTWLRWMSLSVFYLQRVIKHGVIGGAASHSRTEGWNKLKYQKVFVQQH